MDAQETESKKMLEEILALTQENNKMLNAMRRSLRWQRIMSFLYWAFIIGSTVGAFYLFQPYLDGIEGAYSGASDAIKSFQSLTK